MQTLEPTEIRRGADSKSENIDGWRVRLYYWSRHPHILFWMSVAIITLGVFVGKRLEPGQDQDEFEKPHTVLQEKLRQIANHEQGLEIVSLQAELQKAKPELTRVVSALRYAGADDEQTALALGKQLAASRLTPAEIQIANAYLRSIASPLNEPGADLLVLAYQPHPLPFVNEFAADLYLECGREDAALEHFQKELELQPNSQSIPRKLVELYWQKEDFAKLAVMQDNPAYQQFFTPEQALQIASKAHNWKATLQPLWNLQKQAFSEKVPILLTSIAGLVWLILAWQMIQTPGLLSFRTWAPVFAIVLGAASTFPVLFLDLYESEMWGLKHTGFFLSDCLFFIAGVGVREEVCKWIAFLPFVPIVLKRGNRLEAIIIAGCVGLGFAIEENVSYFHSSQSPEIAFGRFLTANFFHFAATGLIGVATCDAIVGFRKKWWKLPATLLVVALAHGFYDSFVGAPLKIFVAIGLSCFILLSLAFFREVARERGPATDQLFPGATLIVGLSTLVATVIACAAQQMGVDAALTAVAVSGVSLGLFVYMFFILFRDGLEEDTELPEPKFEPL